MCIERGEQKMNKTSELYEELMMANRRANNTPENIRELVHKFGASYLRMAIRKLITESKAYWVDRDRDGLWLFLSKEENRLLKKIKRKKEISVKFGDLTEISSQV